MKIEDLKDYEHREEERQEKYRENYRNGRVSTCSSIDVFPKLSYPIAFRAQDCSLSAQAPVFGSTIVPIFPVSKKWFAKVHGFEIGEIPKLIDFCKDTGKIQFTIAAHPLDYEGLDYLDPILAELKPPRLEEKLVQDLAGNRQCQEMARYFLHPSSNRATPFIAEILWRLRISQTDRYSHWSTRHGVFMAQSARV